MKWKIQFDVIETLHEFGQRCDFWFWKRCWSGIDFGTWILWRPYLGMMEAKVTIRIDANAIRNDRVSWSRFSPHSILKIGFKIYSDSKWHSYKYMTIFSVQITLECVYSYPSGFATGTNTQSKFSDSFFISGSSDVSNSFKMYVAVAAVIHSRAWIVDSIKIVGLFWPNHHRKRYKYPSIA